MTTVGKKIWEAWKFFLIRAYNFFFFTTLLDGMEKKFIPYNLLGSQWFQWVDEAKFFWPHLKICFSTYDFSLVGWLGSQKKLRARSQKYISQAWIRFFLATLPDGMEKNLFHTTCWAPSDFNGSMKQNFFDLTWKFVFQLMISVSWVG